MLAMRTPLPKRGQRRNIVEQYRVDGEHGPVHRPLVASNDVGCVSSAPYSHLQPKPEPAAPQDLPSERPESHAIAGKAANEKAKAS